MKLSDRIYGRAVTAQKIALSADGFSAMIHAAIAGALMEVAGAIKAHEDEQITAERPKQPAPQERQT